MAITRFNQIKWINSPVYWTNHLLVLIKKNPLLIISGLWLFNFLYDYFISIQMDGGILDLRMPMVHFLLGTPFILLLFFKFFPALIGRGNVWMATSQVLGLMLFITLIKHLIQLKWGLKPVLMDYNQILVEHLRFLKFAMFALVVWLFYEYILGIASNNQIKLLLAKLRISHDHLSLSPHFILNTLNNIAGKSSVYSDELFHHVVAFSSLMKEAYKDPKKPHSIFEEVSILNNLLLCARTQKKDFFLFLDIRHSVPLEYYQLPRLVLATLLENMLKYGIYREFARPAEIRILLLPDKDRNLNLVCTTFNIINPTKTHLSSGHGLRTITEILYYQFGRTVFFESEKYKDEYSSLMIIPYGKIENSPHR